MTEKRYQVVAECAHVTTETTGVRSQVLLYKGNYLPDDVPADRLKFLLDGGFVAEEGATPVAPNAAVEQDPARGLGSVTTEVLRGEKPEESREDPALVAARQVQDMVIGEGSVARAAEAPRQASDDTALDARRAAARAKLPVDGSEPDGRASQAVWVEYLVANGSRYEDVKDAEKAELQKVAKQQS